VTEVEVYWPVLKKDQSNETWPVFPKNISKDKFKLAVSHT